MNKEFEVLAGSLTDIEIGARGLKAIIQNVRTIITTWRGTVFLDRTFGIDPRIIDRPINLAQAELIMDITQQIEKYEPRVQITSITFEPSDAGNGELTPLVRFIVKEGVLL